MGCRPVWSAATHDAKAYTRINVTWRTLADILTSDHSSSRQGASAAGASRAMKNPPGNPIPGIAAPGAGQHWFPKRLNDARHRFIVMLETSCETDEDAMHEPSRLPFQIPPGWTVQ
jgi:hypothetical protein